MMSNRESDAGEAAAEIRPGTASVSFVQIWRVADQSAQQRWLEIMHANIHILRAKPGFISMTLHVSLDGTRIAVYAQWESEAALHASVSDPEAVAAHQKMAEVGTSDGSAYRVESVFRSLGS